MTYVVTRPPLLLIQSQIARQEHAFLEGGNALSSKGVVFFLVLVSHKVWGQARLFTTGDWGVGILGKHHSTSGETECSEKVEHPLCKLHQD